jgi:hypothetical protein
MVYLPTAPTTLKRRVVEKDTAVLLLVVQCSINSPWSLIKQFLNLLVVLDSFYERDCNMCFTKILEKS